MKRGKWILVFFCLIIGSSFLPSTWAGSDWIIGDFVELRASTTNTGEVDVILSDGLLRIVSKGGTEYDAGSYTINEVIKPGESAYVPVSWVSEGATPGYYDLILDGNIYFANGEIHESYVTVEDAFRLYDNATGLWEIPVPMVEANVHGVTVVSDTVFADSPYMFIVWIDNTGNTLFIPEVTCTFTGNGYDSGPITEIFIYNPCEPGLNPYMAQCRLPEDIEPGEYTCTVDVNKHYINQNSDSLSPAELEQGYLDAFVSGNIGSDNDALLYRWLTEESEGTEQDMELNGGSVYAYNPGEEMYYLGVWPSSDYSDGYCFRWFLEDFTPISDDNTLFCEEEIDPLYEDYQIKYLTDPELKADNPIDDTELYQFKLQEPSMGLQPEEWYWTWDSVPIEEGDHTLEVEVRERSTVEFNTDAFILPDDVPIRPNEPFPIYIMTHNTGDYAFQPSIEVELPDAPEGIDIGIFDTEDESVDMICPPGDSLRMVVMMVEGNHPSAGVEIDLGRIQVTTEVVDIFNPSDEQLTDPELMYRFMADSFACHSYEDWQGIQEDATSEWAWDVAEEDWEGLETHTVYVEVTDDANCWEHSGEGDRIGYATLEVTVSEDNQEPTVDLPGTGTDSESETTGGETVSSTGSETGGTETTPDEPASTGFDFGSIFESFLAWLRSLFG